MSKQLYFQFVMSLLFILDDFFSALIILCLSVCIYLYNDNVYILLCARHCFKDFTSTISSHIVISVVMYGCES